MRHEHAVTFGLATVALLSGLVALIPSTAEACACCGSVDTVTVRGWAPSGRAVAVHRQIEATCERYEMLEIWEAGETSPSRCYDAYGEDPTEAIDCRKVEDAGPNSPLVPEPASLALPPGFEPGASTIANRDLMLWGGYDEDAEAYDLSLEVHVVRGGAGQFRSVPLAISAPDTHEEGDLGSISLWPAPAGRRALALVERRPTDDEWSIAVVWVTLPRGVDRSTLSATVEAVEPRSVPHPPDPDPDRDENHDAARRMARARVYERIGDDDRARTLYTAVANADPSSISAWLAVARLVTRSGHSNKGLAILQRLDRLPCPDCRQRVRSSLGHPDFAAIADRPAFRALGAPR